MFERRLILVSGKGGVGKSAITAALAMLAARRGKRVLALAMLDSSGLAAHLGVDRLGYQPERIQPGLYGAAIERSRALDEYLKLQLKVPRAMPTRQLTSALNILADTAPGVREIITIGKPIYEVWQNNWDLVVTDAPSLGQLQSYLNAPDTISGLVPTGAVQEQAAAMRTTLSNPRISGLTLVSTAEELPVNETTEAIAEIDAGGRVPIVSVIANRILDPLDADPDVVAALNPSPARDAAILNAGLTASQAIWLERLPFGSKLPFLFGLHAPVEVAARLSEACERIA
jgi:anion-transporting  ArsA/GET3 family ATPase